MTERTSLQIGSTYLKKQRTRLNNSILLTSPVHLALASLLRQVMQKKDEKIQKSWGVANCRVLGNLEVNCSPTLRNHVYRKVMA